MLDIPLMSYQQLFGVVKSVLSLCVFVIPLSTIAMHAVHVNMLTLHFCQMRHFKQIIILEELNLN